MKNSIIERLNKIEEILSIISQNQNIKFAYINETSNELWNGHDICKFMQITLSDFITKIASTPDFPIPVIKENNCLSSKWRSGSIIEWIKKQESLRE
ncbi:hypothetical protein [Rodentibacter pneumotropicus]|uniref:hypothetical protein n=1 Tax=Rodentibacter pneumotropicus TaxID=758 RepID=UPI000985EC45|nr:hypothetical protein [Rodentibacter pneumotropicus]OOF62071.1 hypothetical protein BKL50_06750 [Rodentibacter pneumotropicus]THA18310.1 hypothetical protein D3M83_06185 [Rodentibacter pneumotropicus]